MKAFNFRRFVNVARWDLTTNSKFYTRVVLLVMACIATPVLMNSLADLFTAIDMHKHGLSLDILPPEDVSMVVTGITGISSLLGIILSGYMFHNLATRQGRISELTLPASNLERFLWHLVCVFLGISALTLIGTAVADLLHVILGWAILGRTSFHSIFHTIYIDYRGSVFGLSSHYPILFGLCICELSWCVAGYMTLVNAWKYRYNIVFSVLIFIAFNLVLGFSSGLIGSWMGYQGFRALDQFMKGLPDIVVPVGFLCFLTLVLATFIALAYRLYCRAQLTSQRNP